MKRLDPDSTIQLSSFSMIFINKENFNKLLIVFWALWWSIALWTDVVGGMAHLGFIHGSWAPDLNYPFLVKSLQMYSVSSWLAAVLFGLILLGLLISTSAFWWAVAAIRKNKSLFMRRAEAAFIISLSLWLVFFLADQMVLQFNLEENHMVQGGFELLSFMVLYLE